MSENAIVMLVCLAVIAVMAILIYVGGRRQISALKALCEVHRRLDQILAGNRETKTTLEQHRHVLYDAHRRICAVTKSLQKRTS